MTLTQLALSATCRLETRMLPRFSAAVYLLLRIVVLYVYLSVKYAFVACKPTHIIVATRKTRYFSTKFELWNIPENGILPKRGGTFVVGMALQKALICAEVGMTIDELSDRVWEQFAGEHRVCIAVQSHEHGDYRPMEWYSGHIYGDDIDTKLNAIWSLKKHLNLWLKVVAVEFDEGGEFKGVEQPWGVGA